MTSFFTIVSPARSGTMWFSRLLTTEYSYCYHELTSFMLRFPRNIVLFDRFTLSVADHPFEQAQRRWLLQHFPTYFQRLWERASHGKHIVGNSDAFAPRIVPGLSLLWPDMKFVFSVRNGVNCVQSHFGYHSRLPRVERMRLRSKFGARDPFDQCCYLWVEQVGLVESARRWLDGRTSILETTLEKLTRDPKEVRRLWDWLGISDWEKYKDRNHRLMAMVVNARTNVRRVVAWEEIWRGWTGGQRDAFRRICGEMQARLQYPLP